MKTVTAIILLLAGVRSGAGRHLFVQSQARRIVPDQRGQLISVLAHAGDLKIVGRPDLRRLGPPAWPALQAKNFSTASVSSERVPVRRSISKRSCLKTPEASITLRLRRLCSPGSDARGSRFAATGVRDGSGDTVIENVSTLSLEDGSGEIAISNVHGNVRVRDGSGDMTIRGVAGNVEIDDGSGDIGCRMPAATSSSIPTDRAISISPRFLKTCWSEMTVQDRFRWAG